MGTPRLTWTIPEGMSLSSSERRSIEANVSMLERYTTPRSDNVELVGAVIAAMMKTLLLARDDALGMQARSEAYLEALDDIPAWAVKEARRKWYRSESGSVDGQPHNFRYMPAPGILRRLAYRELWSVQSRVRDLGNLLSAQARKEFSDEHCAGMLTKLSGVLHGMAAPKGAEQRT